MLQGKTLMAVGLAFVLASFSAQATLTSVTVNGQNLVYDSGNNATWTQDANLLGTWEGAYGSTSYNDIVNAVIQASNGVIHDTPNFYDTDAINGIYTLTAADFGSGGRVSWWAAQAFVHYLNTLDYGGSSQWALPTSNNVFGFVNAGQLGELYYNQLGGTANGSVPSGPFSNAQLPTFWSGTEFITIPSYAWFFNFTEPGWTGYQDAHYKPHLWYAWAVSPGQVNAVPAPGAVWLFGTGMLGLLGLNRRGHPG